MRDFQIYFSLDPMRELIDRFVGRYQIWRDEQRAERGGPHRNPLIPFAVIAAALVAWDIYKIIVSHHIEWRAGEADVLLIAFLILCVWRPEWAWVMFLIWGASAVIESPWVYSLQPYRYPARVRLMSALLFAGIGVAAFAYGFVLRKRYQSYRVYREQDRAATSGSNQAMQRTADHPYDEL
jgi:hypothetical protein